MRRSARLLAVAAVVAFGAGCGGAKPHFESGAGWHLLKSHGELVAAKVVYAPAGRRLVLMNPPARTVASLPRDGTVIWAMVIRGGNNHFPRRKLPLRLEDGTPSNPFEGFDCAPAVSRSNCFAASGSIWRLYGRYGAYDVDLYVFFGSDHPLPEEVAAADAELSRLRLPHVGMTPTAKTAACRSPRGAGYHDTKISPESGPPGTTMRVSGRLPILSESGHDVGQTSTEVVAYWNLDFDHWTSLVGPHPLAAVAGTPVKLLGTTNVAGACTYHVNVTIPAAPPGTYPVEVLSGDPQGGGSFAPVDFRVTRG